MTVILLMMIFMSVSILLLKSTFYEKTQISMYVHVFTSCPTEPHYKCEIHILHFFCVKVLTDKTQCVIQRKLLLTCAKPTKFRRSV